MKLLPFLFCFFFFTNINSQIIFSPEESTQEFTVDLSDPWIHVRIEASVKNTSDSLILLRWEIIDLEKPFEWKTYIITDFVNGGSWTSGVFSNIAPSIGTNVPYQVEPNDSTMMDIQLQPKEVSGCGKFKIQVAPIDDSTNILAEGIYNFIINVNADCTTPTIDLQNPEIQIFPNPTQDFVTISENNLVDEIRLFSTLGKLVFSKKYKKNKVIDISSFENGIYFIELIDENNQIITTSRLVKF